MLKINGIIFASAYTNLTHNLTVYRSIFILKYNLAINLFMFLI